MTYGSLGREASSQLTVLRTRIFFAPGEPISVTVTVRKNLDLQFTGRFELHTGSVFPHHWDESQDESYTTPDHVLVVPVRYHMPDWLERILWSVPCSLATPEFPTQPAS